MPENPPSETAAHRWLGRKGRDLGPAERLVLAAAKEGSVISRDIGQHFAEELSFGQRLADKVAEFGGSWAFILAFCAFLLLSMIAAIQAPIIMMSQNRQAARDRLDAAHDYEVNLKAEIEIMALHDKLDQLRTREIEALLARQQEQIDLLTRLLRDVQDRAGG